MARLRRSPRLRGVRHLWLAAFVTLTAPTACGSADESCCTVDPPNVGPLAVTTVAGDFDTIWELAWGPDGALWVTERPGTISRVNPATGVVTRAGTLAVNEVGEGGLMGLAFHPDFATTPFVYAAHTYIAGSAVRNRVVRMRWNGTSLGVPEVLLDDIPGSSVHNGARVVVGPDRLLYVTSGDAANTALPQSRTSLAGKVLRLTLDGAPATGNTLGGHIYSLGHRNPQGLAFAPGGALYSTEHGPSDNDELNRIELGRNYGWPTVRGRCDGDAGTAEQPFCTANNVAEPLATWTPTIAPAGVVYYDSALIPEWKGSLLFITLKGSTLYRLQLGADGRSVTGEERLFAGTYGRLRAIAVGPDGSVYLGTSNRDGRGSPGARDDRILRVRPR
ncbi:MAG: PQQ-dependent sugar dehydrogenase [Gemmatimonadaceae bacterium]|nr:PQQ-dependent sugar dehydrogenase [Gemmatimonadaceae bacterium]